MNTCGFDLDCLLWPLHYGYQPPCRCCAPCCCCRCDTAAQEHSFAFEHFIFDESLRGSLSGPITAAAFNQFMRNMDAAYDALLDLTGRPPYRGARIRIRDGGAARGIQVRLRKDSEPEILWESKEVLTILHKIDNESADDWFYAGNMEALAYLFTDHLAGYALRLAAAKRGGKFFHGGMLVDAMEKIRLEWACGLKDFERLCQPWSFFEGGNVVYLLHPIVRHLGLERGWDLFKQVFRSYYDLSYPPAAAATPEERLADFINRCSHFLGSDLQKLWLEAARQRYKEEVTDRLM